MFIIFDVNKSGNIVENDFITGLTSLINDKDTRILCKLDPPPFMVPQPPQPHLPPPLKLNFYIYFLDTFRAIDKDEDNKISRKEFLEFFEESWKASFRLLGEKIQKGLNPHKV